MKLFLLRLTVTIAIECRVSGMKKCCSSLSSHNFICFSLHVVSIQTGLLLKLKMDANNPICPVLKDRHGCYLTLKCLKEIKFGDQVTITDVSTPFLDETIPNKIHENPEKWSSFTNFYFCNSLQEVKKASDKFFISYVRIDGKPEKAALSHIFKVIPS